MVGFRPALCSMSPIIACSKLDFPLPVPPTTATRDPEGTSRSTDSRLGRSASASHVKSPLTRMPVWPRGAASVGSARGVSPRRRKSWSRFRPTWARVTSVMVRGRLNSGNRSWLNRVRLVKAVAAESSFPRRT